MMTSRQFYNFVDPARGRDEESLYFSSDSKAIVRIAAEETGSVQHTDISDPASSSSWTPLSPILSPSRNGYREFESNSIGHFIYPSPPSTSSPPGRNVPLPNVCCEAPSLFITKQPLESFNYSFGPSSPPSTAREELKDREPLSPPPTLPTPTLSLPPSEHDLMPYQGMHTVYNAQCVPVTPLDESHSHLLSPPLSPEKANTEAADDSFVPQSSFFFQNSSHSLSSSVDHEIPDITDDIFDYHSYDFPDFRESRSSQQLWPPATHATLIHDSSKALETVQMPFYAPGSPTWYLQGQDVDMDMPPWGYISQTTSLAPMHVLRSHSLGTSHPPSPPFPHPSSPLLSSPASSDHDFEYHDDDDDDDDDDTFISISPPSSPSLRSFSELPTIEDDEDHLGLTTSFHQDQSDDTSLVSTVASQSPNSTDKAPCIRSFPGVETDDDLISDELASRSSAPEDCIVIPSTPYITPSTLSSPMASRLYHRNDDVRDSYNGGGLLFFDNDLSSDLLASNSRIGAELDQLDPALVASDPALKSLLDLRSRVLASEKKARMVEAQMENIKAFWSPDARKAAKAGEGDQDCETRMQMLLVLQAKKTRKREREKLKEISALIKIRLKERGIIPSAENDKKVLDPSTENNNDTLDSFCNHSNPVQDNDAEGMTDGPHICGHHTKSNKDSVTSMPQLVARMILRRREALPRPSTKPRDTRHERGSVSNDKPFPEGRAAGRRRSSPLIHTMPPDDDQLELVCDEAVLGQSDAQSDASRSTCERHLQYSPLHWHMDVDCHDCSDSATVDGLDDLDLTPLSLSNT